MTADQDIAPVTEAEREALGEFGYSADAGALEAGPERTVLQAYRAGVRDGSRPRVFWPGEPEPTEPVALMDGDGTVEDWTPDHGRPGPVNGGEIWSDYIAEYGPLVAVPDHAAAVRADDKRRGGEPG